MRKMKLQSKRAGRFQGRRNMNRTDNEVRLPKIEAPIQTEKIDWAKSVCFKIFVEQTQPNFLQEKFGSLKAIEAVVFSPCPP